MTISNSNPVNSRGHEYVAQLDSKPGQKFKDTDVLVFSRLGTTNIKDARGNFLKGGFFNASASGFFNNLFKYKAKKADVIAIFKTAGMSDAQADVALQKVKQSSKSHGLSGLSATAVRNQVESFNRQKLTAD